MVYYGDLDLFIADVKVVQGTMISDKYKVHIADRPTIMRVFVGINGDSQVAVLTGELCGYNQNGVPLGCLPPDNKYITAPLMKRI